MDFPVFYLDYFGNRFLMTMMTVIHICVSHPILIGGFPLLVLFEWMATRNHDDALDRFVQRVAFVMFLLVTTVGLFAGIGMWLSASLVAPQTLAVIVRVFFWPLVVAWIAGMGLIACLLRYSLTWASVDDTKAKQRHMLMGHGVCLTAFILLCVFSSILGFMIQPGHWTLHLKAGGGFYNPMYWPQLAYRYTSSIIAGGLLIWFFAARYTEAGSDLRGRIVRAVAIWIFSWLSFAIAGAQWYWSAFPVSMKANLEVALAGLAFSGRYLEFAHVLILISSTIVIVMLFGMQKPKKVPTVLLIFPAFLSLLILGHFEKTRLALQYPHAIAGFSTSNELRPDEITVYQRDGILHYSTYAQNKLAKESNLIEAGEDVFKLNCASCHTAAGINGLIKGFNHRFGRQWSQDQAQAFIRDMESAHPYKVIFAGNSNEVKALSAFLYNIKENRRRIRGSQVMGIPDVEYQDIDLKREEPTP